MFFLFAFFTDSRKFVLSKGLRKPKKKEVVAESTQKKMIDEVAEPAQARPHERGELPKRQCHPTHTSRKVSSSSAFENPVATRIFDGMSKEQREFYESMGREIYGKINFEVVTEGVDGSEVKLEEVVANIRSALISGLRPCDLEQSELAAMRTYYGDDSWKAEYS